jgi:hypothetical protein
MALVVEDGTGKADAESYVSVADTDTYFSDRNITTWTGTDAVKEAALRKATEYLDATYSWAGSGVVETTQALGMPRKDLYDNEARDISETVPTGLKRATMELALASLSAELLPNQTNSDYVKKEKVGTLEIEYMDNAPARKMYLLANRLLSGLYLTKVGMRRAVR